MHQGWVKIHRKIIESPVFDNPNLLKVWLWCLCKVTHSECEVIIGKQIINLRPGQFIFGRLKAAEVLNMNDRTVYDYMKMLQKLGMIQMDSNNKFTLVTVVNWDFYQSIGSENQQQSTQLNTQQSTIANHTYKNEEECNKNEKKYSIVPELETALNEFVDFRKKIKKPMTDKAVELLVCKLNKLTQDVQEQVEILNQSIVNGWTGVYELKKENFSTNAKPVNTGMTDEEKDMLDDLF